MKVEWYYRDWVHLFSEAQVEHQVMQEFDHSPILLSTMVGMKAGRRPFRFLKAWEDDEASFEVVSQT